MKRLVLWLPLAVFALFIVTVAWRLAAGKDDTIRSRLVGQPVPAFAAQSAVPGRPGLSSGDFGTGKPRLLNVFASWCVPCKIEAPQLLELKRRGIPIDAVAIRDRPEDVARFLAQYGDPFERIGMDRDTRVQMALGSSGVPETFVVDGKGIIRHQHIGIINADDVNEIVAAYEAAR
ncbi:MAG TPA: DsbE family thiol:disulfide interchange protein [Allosphingosinicella sp.]|jgi:cytochrome c biogenesis protein CcmG/thiol:disulfide interchange protein DsbE